MKFNDVLKNLNEGIIEIIKTKNAPQISTLEYNKEFYAVKYNNEFDDLSKFPIHKSFAMELIKKGLTNKKFDTATKKEIVS